MQLIEIPCNLLSSHYIFKMMALTDCNENCIYFFFQICNRIVHLQISVKATEVGLQSADINHECTWADQERFVKGVQL